MTADLTLHVEAMDKEHEEFIEVFTKIHDDPKDQFMELFEQMIAVTKSHFAHEEELMEGVEFELRFEHIENHNQLLEEMESFYNSAKTMPPMGTSYINSYAYDKFRRHLMIYDTLLAEALNAKA